MKGIYLTEEGKKEIEVKIAELDKTEDPNSECFGIATSVYQQILSSATILPVYSNWDDVELYPPDNESQIEKTLRLKNGVIIQPKK
jgi:hypothetical protein